MSKKILIFSLVYLPNFVGGAEIAVKEITDRITPDEVTFDMITLRTERLKEETIGNIRIHRIGPYMGGRDVVSRLLLAVYKYKYPFLACIRAIRLHRKNNFDAVWSIMANYAGFAGLFFKIFNKRIKFILTLQEGDPILYIKRRVSFLYPLFKMIFKKADIIQAISNYLADFARAMGYTKEVYVIPNGVDLDIFSKEVSLSELTVIKQEIGKQEGDIFLVTASRLVKKNAVGDIISALALLPENYKLLIIGSGKLENELKLQAHKLCLYEASPEGRQTRIVFIGQKSYTDLPKYLYACDIFVRPSLSEGLGNSFLEAMAVGVPVIATPVGGIVDFLKDRETGVFCEVSNPVSIKEAVLKLADPMLRDTVVRNGRTLVENSYQWGTVARVMQGVFTADFRL